MELLTNPVLVIMTLLIIAATSALSPSPQRDHYPPPGPPLLRPRRLRHNEDILSIMNKLQAAAAA